jgi:23S rRNA (cytosine1962-C5)-methyltransferase
MARDAGYELLDAGDGRRLERLGGVVVDRPAPMASDPRRDTGAWRAADLRFDRDRGWTGSPSEPWTADVEGLVLELKASQSGQVGLFPEHTLLWPALREAVANRPAADAPEVLHLFAHTGATTLVLARAGARVTHVDASRPAVTWARRNAVLSRLTDRPIRWIVDDAEAYVGREIRRGRRYAGVVLDPPSFGHGPDGRPWRLDDRLPDLLAACAALTTAPPGFVLLTSHTPEWDAERLAEAARTAWGPGDVEAGPLVLRARSGAGLPLGAFAGIMDR